MIRYLNENINCHQCCSVKHCNTVTLWMVKILNSYYPEAHGTQYHGSAATEYCGIDILAKTFWIHSSAFPLSVTDKQSLSNLQKKEVCTLLFVPVKCFKICHISCKYKKTRLLPHHNNVRTTTVVVVVFHTPHSIPKNDRTDTVVHTSKCTVLMITNAK